VVHISAAVVANGSTDRFGDGLKRFEEIFCRMSEQVWMLFQSGVEVLEIGSLMLGIVDLDRSGVDNGLRASNE
jgi:hypothetical protein